MRKSRFAQEQIIAILAERKLGVPTTDACRTDACKLKTLDTENARLSEC